MCLAGASWLHQEILKKNPEAPLRVYAVWEKALPTDSRSEWDSTVLSDPRVVHFWDAERLVSQTIASEGNSAQVAGHLDEYFVFGPEGRWDDTPAGLRDAGRNILGRSSQLREALVPLLAR